MAADEERALSEALRRLELAPLEDVEPLRSVLCSQEQAAAFLARRRAERAEGLKLCEAAGLRRRGGEYP